MKESSPALKPGKEIPVQAPPPPDEVERLKALGRCEILDTKPEPDFDDITFLASRLCGTPIALISLVDEQRQWFKSKIGMTESETSREISFCAHGILQSDIFVVEDARADRRFCGNPLVTGSHGVQFYAGAPLMTKDGHALGMLCVMDRMPRGLSIEQRSALQALSRQVVARLELRKSLAEVNQTVEQLRSAEEELRWKTAFLEAQANSSIDGILVVDQQGRKILQNRRMIELWRIPPHIAEDPDDRKQLAWVTETTKNPAKFLEKVIYLNSHTDEVSMDEIELKSGTTLDRYSSPVFGVDGIYYGRIWTFRDITARKRAEEELRLLGSAVQQAREAIVITDAELDFPGPRILFVNPAFTEITGYMPEEITGKTPRILQGPRTERVVLDRLRASLARGESFFGETINYRKDGKEFYLEWQIAPLEDKNGKITHFVSIQRDTSERRRIETQVLQSQKMETVGKLAGGIAHEFNNILTAIIGQSELLLGNLPAGSPLTKHATEIGVAAERAAILTRQLLAYGRRQFLRLETLDLNRVIAGMEGMLQLLMGLHVELRIIPARDLYRVKADASQLEQVVINMAINAREAMAEGGRLTIETGNISLNEESVGDYAEMQPGNYARLVITDTGTGMSEEVKARVFEPFFSTKSTGQGAGLGLSTCYGIIRQSGGHVRVYSKPGQGTAFEIYLPESKGQIKMPVQHLDSSGLAKGTETILLVEDDPALREVAAMLLRGLNYTVWPAANGMEALDLRQQGQAGKIDLLFTDIVMPHMSGKELSGCLRALCPDIRVLFASAYAENTVMNQGALDKGTAFLQKPYTPSMLAKKVREVLDQVQ